MTDRGNHIIDNCRCCGMALTANDLLHDPTLKLIGMAILNEDYQSAYYYFRHYIPICGTTLFIPVQELADYILEPIPSKKFNARNCSEGFCADPDNHQECHEECFYAPFRRFLLRLLKLKNQSGGHRETREAG